MAQVTVKWFAVCGRDAAHGGDLILVRTPWAPPVHRSRRRGREQRAQSYEIIRRRGEGEDPADRLRSAMMQLSKQAHAFTPAEALFHQFAFALTRDVAGVARGATIHRAVRAARMEIRSDVRGDA